MSRKLDRFKKRQALKNRTKKNTELYDVNNLAEISRGIDSTLISEIKKEQNKEFRPVYDLSVSPDEVKSYLNILDKEFSAQKYNALFDSTKDVVIDQLLKPLHLSRSDLAEGDVDGGPVTTLNNFENGIVANEDDKKSHEDWLLSQKQFDDKPYRGQEFKKKRKEIFKANEELKDGYTGKVIPKDGRSHLEHVTSAHEIELDSKSQLAMTKEERVTMATDDKNLTMTDASLNQSKGDKDLINWDSSQNAKNKDKSNGEHYGTDKDLIQEKYNRSKNHIKSTSNNNYTKKLARDTFESSKKEAVNMGLQQAIGNLFSEVISAIFAEVKDSFNNGFKTSPNQSFWEALKTRLLRVSKKVLGNWTAVINSLKSGVMGAISGFISNICTVIINLLLKTSKNIVRLIRESFMSLMKALKLILMPPEGMTLKQSAHEASKLIGTGLVVSLGIFAEEAIANTLKSFAIPFSDIISVTITGLLTGLGSLLVVFLLDKLDLFGVVKEERHLFITGAIDTDMSNNINECEDIISRMGIIT